MFTNYEHAQIQRGIKLQNPISKYVHPIVAATIMELGWDSNDAIGLSTVSWMILATLRDSAIDFIREAQMYDVQKANEIIIGKSVKFTITSMERQIETFFYQQQHPSYVTNFTPAMIPAPATPATPPMVGLIPDASYTRFTPTPAPAPPPPPPPPPAHPVVFESQEDTSPATTIPCEGTVINLNEFPALTPPLKTTNQSSPDNPLKFADIARSNSPSASTSPTAPKLANSRPSNPMPSHYKDIGMGDAIIAKITEIVENVSGVLYVHFDEALCFTLTNKMPVKNALEALDRLKHQLEMRRLDDFDHIGKYTMGICNRSNLYGCGYSANYNRARCM